MKNYLLIPIRFIKSIYDLFKEWRRYENGEDNQKLEGKRSRD
jgi:hypothetical protein